MVRDSFCLRARRRPVALALIAAIAGLACGGCGAGGGASASRGTHSQTIGRSTTSSTSGSSTTTAALLAGTGRPAVTIGDKNYTEQFVLGQLYLQALKAQGFKVNISENIGPPDVVRQALATGSLAMYPDYLDIFAETIAGDRRAFASARAVDSAMRAWASRHGLSLLRPTPFSDTSAIAVTVAYAADHRVRSLGDLGRVAAGFGLGGAAQFETIRSGLPALRGAYGVTPRRFTPLAIGSQYHDLDTGAVQAAYVNTTDGELASGDYRVLADPRHIFGFGNVVPVVSRAALVKEGPAFAATIDRVDRTLTLATMRALNNAADATGASPSAIAAQYLQTHGLLTPLPSASR